MGLLIDIQNDIINPSISTATALRKGLMLAYTLKHEEFKNWVMMELDGYDSNSETFNEWLSKLPDYRKFRPLHRCDATNGYSPSIGIPFSWRDFDIPDQIKLVHLGQGIAELEKMADTDSRTLIGEWPSSFVALANMHIGDGQYITRIYNEFPVTVIKGIIETVRNRLLRFTLELAELDPGIDEHPSRAISLQQQLANIYHITIMGDNHMSTFDQSNQSVQGNQYNAARDINFDNVQNANQFAAKLGELLPVLQSELTKANIDEDVKIDAEGELKKAINASSASQPDQVKIIGHLKSVKEIVQGVANIAAIGVLLEKAIQAAQQLIP